MGGGEGEREGETLRRRQRFSRVKNATRQKKILGPLLKQPLQFLICKENPFLKVNSMGALVRVKILQSCAFVVALLLASTTRTGRKSCLIRVNEALNAVPGVVGKGVILTAKRRH